MPTIVGKSHQSAKQITCRNCGSVLEYFPMEEQRDYTCDYLGDRDYYSYVNCPCCHKQVITKGY